MIFLLRSEYKLGVEQIEIDDLFRTIDEKNKV